MILKTRLLHFFWSIAFVLFFIHSSIAQPSAVYTTGELRSFATNKKMEGVQVQLFVDGKQKDQRISDVKGGFELQLQFDVVYELRFVMEGYVTKAVEINTKGIPEEDQKAGDFFTDHMVISMIPYREEMDVEGLSGRTVGRYNYQVKGRKSGVKNDAGYQAQMSSVVAEIEQQYLQLEEFDQLMQEGEELLRLQQQNAAIEKFRAARTLFPKSKKAAHSLYEAYIGKADRQFEGKQYQDARAVYVHALTMNVENAYPQAKIDEIDELLKPVVGPSEPAQDSVVTIPESPVEEPIVVVEQPEEPASNNLPVVPSESNGTTNGEHTIGSGSSSQSTVVTLSPQEKLARDKAAAQAVQGKSSAGSNYEDLQRQQTQRELEAQQRAQKAHQNRVSRRDSIVGETQETDEAEPAAFALEENTFEQNGKTIVERIVTKGDQRIVYRKVEARWGTFYFKNGQAITAYIWEAETSEK